jgi:hypothetical protein
VDNGASPLDVDNVLLLAWVMPTNLDVTADRGIIMNKSVSCCLLAARLCLLSAVD